MRCLLVTSPRRARESAQYNTPRQLALDFWGVAAFTACGLTRKAKKAAKTLRPAVPDEHLAGCLALEEKEAAIGRVAGTLRFGEEAGPTL